MLLSIWKSNSTTSSRVTFFVTSAGKRGEMKDLAIPPGRLLRPRDLFPDPGDTAARPIRPGLRRRIFGEVHSHTGMKLGLLGRLTFEWLWTDDPYFGQLDQYWDSIGFLRKEKVWKRKKKTQALAF